MILVAFLGNDVMGDDGIGAHLYRYTKDKMPDYVKSIYLHTDVLRLLSYYSGEESIVFVDAMYGENIPCGEVKIVPFSDISLLEATMKHAHEIGLIGSIQLMVKTDRQLENANKVFFMIGVDKNNVKPSEELSRCLANRIHEISDRLLMLLHKIHYSC